MEGEFSMQIFSIIISIILFSILFFFFEDKREQKRIRSSFQQCYGQKIHSKTSTLENLDEISLYYNLIKKEIPSDELVDEITWEDLEMNKIFEKVNHTTSYVGEQFLFSELHRLPKDKANLTLREKMIRFFHDNPEKRVDTQCILHKLQKESIHFYIPEFIQLLHPQTIPFVSLYKWLLYSLLFFFFSGMITQNSYLLFAASINFFLNLALYAVNKMKYELYLESLYGIIATVKTAKSLSALYPMEASSLSASIQNLDKISHMVVLLKQKKQIGFSGDVLGLVTDYFFGAFMLDFILYERVLKVLLHRKDDFFSLFQFVGEMDLCIAIASFRESLPYYCCPNFHETNFCTTALYHPLIENAVANDFQLKKGCIITGSNASGKSTFIKAIATNFILGQNVNTCTAKTISIPNVKVLTSMSLRDDVTSGESYYMREIKYLFRMIKESKKGRTIFCGIDEILRGTNTAERIAASIAILHYLYQTNCILIVATHDLELAKTLDKIYENYYFCESIQNGDVVFDYQIRSGICSSYNAIRLLESIGFPEEIIKEARFLRTSKR